MSSRMRTRPSGRSAVFSWKGTSVGFVRVRVIAHFNDPRPAVFVVGHGHRVHDQWLGGDQLHAKAVERLDGLFGRGRFGGRNAGQLALERPVGGGRLAGRCPIWLSESQRRSDERCRDGKQFEDSKLRSVHTGLTLRKQGELRHSGSRSRSPAPTHARMKPKASHRTYEVRTIAARRAKTTVFGRLPGWRRAIHKLPAIMGHLPLPNQAIFKGRHPRSALPTPPAITGQLAEVDGFFSGALPRPLHMLVRNLRTSSTH